MPSFCAGQPYAGNAVLHCIFGGYCRPDGTGGAVFPRRLRIRTPSHRPAPVRPAEAGAVYPGGAREFALPDGREDDGYQFEPVFPQRRRNGKHPAGGGHRPGAHHFDQCGPGTGDRGPGRFLEPMRRKDFRGRGGHYRHRRGGNPPWLRTPGDPGPDRGGNLFKLRRLHRRGRAGEAGGTGPSGRRPAHF